MRSACACATRVRRVRGRGERAAARVCGGDRSRRACGAADAGAAPRARAPRADGAHGCDAPRLAPRLAPRRGVTARRRRGSWVRGTPRATCARRSRSFAATAGACWPRARSRCCRAARCARRAAFAPCPLPLCRHRRSARRPLRRLPKQRKGRLPLRRCTFTPPTCLSRRCAAAAPMRLLSARFLDNLLRCVACCALACSRSLPRRRRSWTSAPTWVRHLCAHATRQRISVLTKSSLFSFLRKRRRRV